MQSLLIYADDVLRRRPWTTSTRGASIGSLLLLITAFGMLYGAAMGSFGGVLWPNSLQVVYSAVKLPLLLLATFALSLPSFFVVNSLLGLRQDFAESARALIATQAGLAVVLASLAPFTLLWYASSGSYLGAVMFNTVMFGIASFTAQWILRGYYEPLIRRQRQHRWMLRTWLVVYAFVGIQMGWVLRPFVGDPSSPVQFFREDSWGNAYVVVARLFWRMLSG